MSQPSETPKPEAAKTPVQRLLDVVEKVGNMVPHPVVFFLILIAIVWVLSHALYLAGISVYYQVVNPQTHQVEQTTTAVRSLFFQKYDKDAGVGRSWR